MKKLIFLALLVFAGVFGYRTLYPKPMPSSQALSSAAPESVKPKYPLSEIEKHGSKDDCWIALEGKVYDVTPFVKSGMHPGKEKILMGCGKDATTLFNSRPGSGTSHSERARKMLPNYFVGELAE